MQDSMISWVKVPLKHLLNLVLSETRQHHAGSFLGGGFFFFLCYSFFLHRLFHQTDLKSTFLFNASSVKCYMKKNNAFLQSFSQMSDR